MNWGEVGPDEVQWPTPTSLPYFAFSGGERTITYSHLIGSPRDNDNNSTRLQAHTQNLRFSVRLRHPFSARPVQPILSPRGGSLNHAPRALACAATCLCGCVRPLQFGCVSDRGSRSIMVFVFMGSVEERPTRWGEEDTHQCVLAYTIGLDFSDRAYALVCLCIRANVPARQSVSQPASKPDC